MQDKAKNNPGLLLPNYVVDPALYYYGTLLFQGMNHRFFLYIHSCFSTIIISFLCKTMHPFLILISVTGNQKYLLNHCWFRLNLWNGLLLEREDIFQIYAQKIRDTLHISQYSKIVIYPFFSLVVWTRERFIFLAWIQNLKNLKMFGVTFVDWFKLFFLIYISRNNKTNLVTDNFITLVKNSIKLNKKNLIIELFNSNKGLLLN